MTNVILNIPLTGATGVDAPTGLPVKQLSLMALVFQNSAVTLIMRYTVAGLTKEERYLPSMVVLLSELLKSFVCVSILALYLPERNFTSLRRVLYRELIGNSREMLKLSIPALLYLIQNNLQFIASSNLDPATFQVTYQLKILTTALFSVMMLRKTLNPLKWMSLVMLTIGIGLVQVSTNTSSPADEGQNNVQGLVAVLSACILSGLAGVYFEKLLKAPNNRSKLDDLQEKGKANSIALVPEDAQLWVRSLQLSVWSTFLALFLTVIWKDGKEVLEYGPFRNFTPVVWLLVAVHALGGIIVGIVVKYADNILKGFATSVSILLSTALSVLLMNFAITGVFLLGTSLVVAATYLYSL
ncbi:hypothetical protein INT44_007198 [Umbelopsis vinacea]|uniref:Uncharacterized protein n=1 Tax=Umbelopsis vinacea TaxID=44442 RepID=A0A8H7PMR5_9FUNG|nr:hypothetical protein INT44_007198 [Umbelopsis vinacea]